MRLLLWQTESSGKVLFAACGRAILERFYANCNTYVCRPPIDIYSRLRTAQSVLVFNCVSHFAPSQYSVSAPRTITHTHQHKPMHTYMSTYANFISHLNLCDFIFFLRPFYMWRRRQLLIIDAMRK